MPPKAKGAAKAKAKAKGAPKARAKGAPRPLLRRPAAQMVRLRRPAANLAEGVAGDNMEDLSPAILGGLGFVHLHDAVYYGRKVQLAGTILGLRVDQGENFADFKVSGTKDDVLLRILSGKKDRLVTVHLCAAGCQDILTGETLIHGKTYRAIDKDKEAWFSNLEAVAEDITYPEDEMAKLRKELEKAKAEAKGVEETPIPSEEEDGKKKKKKKKKRKKSRSKEKKKDKKTDKEEKKKKKKEASSSSSLDEGGKKDPEALFKGTGLDPEKKRRDRVIRRAKRLGKSSHKKKKKKSSGGGSGGSSSSGSGTDSKEDEGGGLFENDRKVKALYNRYPGALTYTALMEAREQLLTQSGTSWALDKEQITPLFVHYTRQGMVGQMAPPMMQEAVTISSVLDSLLLGRVAAACDILSQRLKALEVLSRGSHWTVARQLEIIRTDHFQLSQDTETLEAARRAREEEKLRSLTSRGPNRGDADQNYRGRGRGTGYKGAGRGKGNDGKNQKGKEDRKDEKPWQKDKRDK